MPYRTTSAAVANILEDSNGLPKDSSDNPDASAQIAVANELVTEYCSASGYSAGRLTMIETWLAAHYVMLSRQNELASESAGDVSKSNQAPARKGIASGFTSTKYGETAVALDTAGNFLRASVRQEKGWLKRTSVGIYGGRNNTRQDDQDLFLNPISPYSAD